MKMMTNKQLGELLEEDYGFITYITNQATCSRHSYDKTEEDEDVLDDFCVISPKGSSLELPPTLDIYNQFMRNR